MGLSEGLPQYVKLDVTWADIQAAAGEGWCEVTRDPISRAACRALGVPLGTLCVGINAVTVCEGDVREDRVIAWYRMEEAGCQWLWRYDLDRRQARPIEFGLGLIQASTQDPAEQDKEQAPAGQPAGDGAHKQKGSASYDIYDEPDQPGDGPGPDQPEPTDGGLWREPGDEPDPEPAGAVDL